MEKLNDGKPRRLKKRWNPKEWKPEYEAIVALSCTGLAHTIIAERYGYTPIHIGNIVNCEYGKALRAIILAKLRSDVSLATPDLIKDTQAKAVERIHAVLNNDILAENNPLAIFDRSLKYMHWSGQLGNGNPSDNDRNTNGTRVTVNNQTNVAIGTDALKILQQGAQKSLEVLQTHQTVEPRGIGTGTEAEAIAKKNDLLKLQAANVSQPLDISSQIKDLERQAAAEGLTKLKKIG